MERKRIEYGCSMPVLDIFNSIIRNTECNLPNEVDISIPPCGMANYFSTGVFYALRELINSNRIKIKRYFGTSSGAIAAVGLACGFDACNWKNGYMDIYDNSHKNILLIDCYAKLLERFLPEDAYQLCTNKVFIFAREVTITGLKSHIFSKYRDNAHLIQCIKASGTIPYITRPVPWTIVDGKKYIDGITSCPFNIERPTIIIRVPSDYSIYKKIVPCDQNLDALILRGFQDARLFMQDSKSTNSISLKNKHSKTTYRKRYILFTLLVFYWFRKRWVYWILDTKQSIYFMLKSLLNVNIT